MKDPKNRPCIECQEPRCKRWEFLCSAKCTRAYEKKCRAYRRRTRKVIVLKKKRARVPSLYQKALRLTAKASPRGHADGERHG